MHQPPTNRRGHSWLITISLLGFAGGYYFLSFRPNQEELSELEAELADTRQAAAAMDTLPAQIHRVRGETSAAAELTSRFHADSPARADAVLFARVSETLSDHGCQTTRLHPEPSATYGAVSRAIVHVDFRGDFHQIFAALAALEEWPRAIWIDEFHLEAGNDGKPGLQCRTRLSVFSAKPEKPG